MKTLEQLEQIQWQALEDPEGFPEQVEKILGIISVREDLLQQERIRSLARTWKKEEDVEILGEIRDWGARIAFWLREEEYRSQAHRDLPSRESCQEFLEGFFGAETEEEVLRIDDPQGTERLAFLLHALQNRQQQSREDILLWYREGYDPEDISEKSLRVGSAWR